MIQRAAGFTGNLFDVSGVLYMLDNSDSTLVVDGGSVNGVQAAGSLIHVASGAKFSMSTGITLTNNKVVADATTADTTAAAILMKVESFIFQVVRLRITVQTKVLSIVQEKFLLRKLKRQQKQNRLSLKTQKLMEQHLPISFLLEKASLL